MNSTLGIWVEKRILDGKEAEVFIGICECCKQPTVRSRVVRVTKEEFERWKWLDVYKTKGMGWLIPWCLAAGTLGLFGAASAESLLLGLLAFIGAIGLLYLLPFFLIYGIRDRKVDAEKKEILKRYGEYNLEDVGLDEFYWKKYRILPQEES